VSFDIVFDSFARSEAHIKEVPLDVPYRFQLQSLERVKELFLRWLDVYKAYANGYRKELLTRTTRYVIRMLSSFTDTLEGKVREVFEARIPDEAYILVNELFKQLGPRPVTFVLAEGTLFEQTSIFRQLSETIDKMSAPRPAQGAANIDITMRDIQTRDVPVIYYEQGQYDNVLAWPLLLHEAFHYLYTYERLDRLAKDCPNVSWLEEALIDMYIVNYFGPAYALSLATYLQRFPHEKTVSHPSFVARIFIALQYLVKMKKENKLPPPVSHHTSDVFDYLREVWSQHKEVDTAQVQDQVETVYNTAEQGVIEVISEKTQPFSEFLITNEEQRKTIHARGGFEYVENQVLSVSDVLEYFEAGIPVAADPRILFNTFTSRKSQERVHAPRLRIFIVESLKKWHIKNSWSAAKAASSS
jgi:hypothetical protein